MSRGELPYEKLTLINSLLPEVVPLQVRTLEFLPDLISLNLPKDSDTPIAAVCLQDCASVLCEVRIALIEYHAHRVYYREHRKPPDPNTAVIMEKFYLDDAVLRLYAAGEHLAEAVRCMFRIFAQALKKYRNAYTSQQCVVGKYMKNEYPNSVVTRALVKVAQSDDWMRSREYRDKWVHVKPPIIEGTGIVYNRTRRWQEELNGARYVLHFGGGDKPELSVEKLAKFATGAFQILLKAATCCIDEYERMLS